MPPLVYRPADMELVRRVLVETRVATKPPSPSLGDYLAAWWEAGIRWIAEFLSQRSEVVSGILNVALVIAIVTVALALALVAVSIIRRVRDRVPRGPSVPRLGGIERLDAPAFLRDRAAWRKEIETRLSRGDIPGALEALWWWLALSLSLESDADPSWTTRELLGKARRAELLGLGGALDVLMYGPRMPLREDVTACLRRFEEALA